MLRRAHFTVVASLWLFAAGCQFRLNPSFIPDAGADTPPMPPPAADDDLAAAPPADLALPPSPPAATSDLASRCTRVDEPFAHDPSATWTLMGSAAVDAAGGLELTALGFNVAGSAFYDAPLAADSFDARFRFRIGDGSGADGLAFVVAAAPSASALTPYGNGVLNAGYGLGYLGMNGLGVEIDTFLNVGNGDPNGNHVSLVRTADGAHRLNGAPANMLLRSTSARSAHVRLAARHLTVDIDGAAVLDADLPDDVVIPSGTVFFGFTGASGAINDRHAVSDVHFAVGPAGDCF